MPALRRHRRFCGRRHWRRRGIAKPSLLHRRAPSAAVARRHAGMGCVAWIASRTPIPIDRRSGCTHPAAEKVCAVFAQTDLCGAGSACRSSARRDRFDGHPSPIRERRARSDDRWRRAAHAPDALCKCLFFSALRNARGWRRCRRVVTSARRGPSSRPAPMTGRLPRPEKSCAGLLTSQKSVIRFRPAEDSCGIE